MLIEAKVIEYLSKKVSIPVYAEVPEERPEEFIVVDLIEGGETNKIQASTISIMAYSYSKYRVAELDEIIRGKMLSINCLDEIASCKLGGFSSRIDTTTKSYRYESIYNLFYY